MTSVAVLCCRREDDSDPGDLYPDADRPFLLAALARAGLDATAVSWDDESIDWSRFAAAVISSTWDSVDRPGEYLAWAGAVSAVTTLLNPNALLQWSMDKSYLRALERRGIAVVPTQWVQPGTEWAPPSQEFVIKPSISAGGRETARYRLGEADAAEAEAHVARLLARGQTVMVQPYVAGVEGTGERKLVYLDGAFSHAVRVGPQLVAGSGVIPKPWKGLPPVELAPAGAAPEAVGRQVLDAVTAEVGVRPVYARVDLVPAPDGQLWLGEVELIDPTLYWRLAPAAAADRMAEAVATRCRLH
jgi:hypothetical protein